jgi:hypothetical protein
MKEEYLKTYAWMNTLRGGVLRDVYALIYQLEHDGRRKGTVQVGLGYIGKRLGYSNQRNVQRAIAELKEMGLLEVEYGNGKKSIFKTQTPANIAPLTEGTDPRQFSTPDNLAPLTNQHPSPAKIAPLTPYITKDNRVDNSSSSPACARERLQKWFEESSIKEWANMLLQRNHFDKDTTSLLDDFFDNDFEVREDCEQSRRMEVLKHFQNWLPKYINKLKNEQNNGNNHTNTKARNSGIISPEDFARSFGLGWNIGKREQ